MVSQAGMAWKRVFRRVCSASTKCGEGPALTTQPLPTRHGLPESPAGRVRSPNTRRRMAGTREARGCRWATSARGARTFPSGCACRVTSHATGYAGRSSMRKALATPGRRSRDDTPGGSRCVAVTIGRWRHHGASGCVASAAAKHLRQGVGRSHSPDERVGASPMTFSKRNISSPPSPSSWGSAWLGPGWCELKNSTIWKPSLFT